jgi:ubiquinone/menaquinone biosynthesis C-methylase UbiE
MTSLSISVKKSGSPVALDPTDERMVPESAGTPTFWEHVYRYAFACRFVPGKRVLDIACGEGYGAAAFQKAGAAHVIGVDVSESTCSHARNKYLLDARPGTAERIPLPDNSVEIVVSFETIEHVPDPHCFLDECVRVLAPGGRLVISTPNKEIYAGRLGARNQYHCSEMTDEEFASALRARFYDIHFYTQRPDSAAWWSPRTLVCESTPWNHIRGFQRLRRAVQMRYFPEAVSDPTTEQRAAAVDVILKVARGSRRLLNQYVVRSRRSWHRERSVYLIATAVR